MSGNDELSGLTGIPTDGQTDFLTDVKFCYAMTNLMTPLIIFYGLSFILLE